MKFIFREEKLFTLGHIPSTSHNSDKTPTFKLLSLLIFLLYRLGLLGEPFYLSELHFPLRAVMKKSGLKIPSIICGINVTSLFYTTLPLL